MIYINIIVEGSTEEHFVNDVLTPYFAQMDKYIAARRITTGWDAHNRMPAKGGLTEYAKLKNDIQSWIKSDNHRPNTWYTTFIDLYRFPKDNNSPYTPAIQNITNPYQKVERLEEAIGLDINHPYFIPYVQLHEFEALVLVEPDKLLVMYPDSQKAIDKLKTEIQNLLPEEINETPHNAPSKRIINHIPAYEGQKAQVAPLVAADVGITKLKQACPNFNQWIEKLETLTVE